MIPSNDLHRLAMRLFVIAGKIKAGHYAASQDELHLAELQLKQIQIAVTQLAKTSPDAGTKSWSLLRSDSDSHEDAGHYETVRS